MKLRTGTAALLTAALLTAACGSSGEKDGPGASAPPRSEAPSTTPAPTAPSSSASAPANTTTPSRTPTPSPPPPAPPVVDATAVLASVGAAAARAGGTIHVTVLDATGNPLVRSPGAAEPVYTASLVKLYVVEQLLERRAAGQVQLDGGDLSLMQRAIVASDDQAMNQLWVKFDGAGLTASAAATGLTATAPPARPGKWGEATTSSDDITRFLALLPGRLSGPDLALLTGWLRGAAATGADGFDQSFGLLGPVRSPEVGAKQGWMCCIAGERHLHSVGLLGGRYVALLGEFPSTTGWAAAQTALDEAAAAVAAA